jgi:shikimate kinase
MPDTKPPGEPPAPIRHVVITGLMGSGKTTVGQALAKRLGWAWRDSDVDIEAATGRTVRELRETEGVDTMHARESTQLIEALAAPQPTVISAAASVIDSAAARAALTTPNVAVFWLHASPTLLASRFASPDKHRPVFGPSPETVLAEQAAHREPLAAAIGAHVIDVDGRTPDEEVAQAIKALGRIGS